MSKGGVGIFAEWAPKYWERGLPVIPLAPRGKNPIPVGWTEFAGKMPEPMLQQSWLASHPGGNIGLVLGPESGMIMLDIDTPDKKVMQELRRRLPKSPWHRVGAKGAVWAYRYNGIRSFRIRAEGHGTMVELLGNRLQVVVPPSIHPKTGEAYTENVCLLDVMGKIPELPSNVEEIIRNILEELGYKLGTGGPVALTNFVSVGARDTQMVSHAGLLATDVLRGTRSLLEVLKEMDFWCTNYAEKVEGDPLDAAKGQEKVIQFLIKDVLNKNNRRVLPDGWDEGLTEKEKTGWGLNVFNEENEQWDAEKVKRFLTAKLELYAGSDNPGAASAINYAVARIAESRDINSMEEDRLLHWIRHISEDTVSVVNMRKHMQALRQGEIQGVNHTELAEAVQKSIEEEGDLRYHNESFWQWGGSHWVRRADSYIMRIIAKKYGEYNAARKAGDHSGITKVLSNICEADINFGRVRGVNFANGFLTDDLQLHPHDQEFGCTYTLPYRYVPGNTKCDMFLQFLEDCWGEDDDYDQKVTALRMAICATLFQRGAEYQRAILLVGVPHSGKTQMLNIVLGLVPEEGVSNISPGEWGDKFLPAQMYGKILNYAGELSENRYIQGDVFKKIVDGSLIPAQLKGKQIFNFRPTCAQWFGSNYQPKSQDTSDGFNRRWLMLGFNKVVADKDRITDLAGKILAEERETIVAWATGVVGELKKNQGYILPSSHNDLINCMANDNNPVRKFLTTSTVVKLAGNDQEIDQVSLFNEYVAFCMGVARMAPGGMNRFAIRMRELATVLGFGYKSVKTYNDLGLAEKEVYTGITLRND